MLLLLILALRFRFTSNSVFGPRTKLLDAFQTSAGKKMTNETDDCRICHTKLHELLAYGAMYFMRDSNAKSCTTHA